MIIYPSPHQTRPPILIIVETNTPALDITNKAAILFCMSPQAASVDLHYLYFGTRNKHTPASTLQEIGVRDYGVIRLLMSLLGVVVTARERTSPLSTSPTCKQRPAHLLLCPANCGCKNSLLRLAEKSRVVKDYGLRIEMQSSSRTRASPKVKSLQSSERRQQYGLKTKSASSNVLR